MHDGPIPIGIAVVEHNGQYLVGTRGDTQTLSGAAEFPGGKCEPDETTRDAAIREAREETGLLVVPKVLLHECVHTYDHGEVDLHFWLCHPTMPDVMEDPHAPFRWVSLEELGTLEFPAANAPVIDLLINPPE